MLQYAINVLVTVVVVVAVSEVGRRSSFWGAALASLPLTSLLAFIWIYRSTGNSQTVITLSHGIFWLVLAALPLFLIFPALLKSGMAFWSALGVLRDHRGTLFRDGLDTGTLWRAFVAP